MSPLRFIPAIILLALVSDLNLYSQCCSAGNPGNLLFSEHVSVKARAWIISSAYKHGYSGRYFKGDRDAALDFEAPASFNYIDLRFAWGISKRISLLGEAGYFLSKTQINPEPFPTDQGHGLADASLVARYRLFKSMKHLWELHASFGTRLPVGVFDQEKDGVKLPLTVQPSSGSMVFLGGILGSKRFEQSRLQLFSSILFEIPRLIDSKNFYYRYGNLYNISIAGSFPVQESLTSTLQLQYETRNHASREQQQEVESSGFQVVSITPQLEYRLMKNLSLHGFIKLPVYRYFNGVQLANSYETGLRIVFKPAG